MDGLRQDLLFALRVLRRDRAYAAAVILTLAICLGANTAIFTVVRSVLQRPLPYPESSRLISTFDGFPKAGVERAGTSVPNYMDRRGMTDVFSSVALYQWWGFKVGQGRGAEQISAMNVTPSFFQTLGATAERGRLLSEDEGTPGKNKVAVLSHDFAAKQPGGVDGSVGRTVRLNEEIYQVVGVLPQTFNFLSPEVRVFTPLAFTPEELGEDRRWSQNHQMIGRLASDVSIERAQARLDAQNARYLERAGPLRDALRDSGYHTAILSLEGDMVRNVRSALQMLWGGVVFVVLIAAVNIANLSLVRANGRMKELATRNAIGAGGRRIAKQLITEATLLTLIGAGLGVGLGFLSLNALEWIGFTDLPRAHEIRLDGVVLALTLAPAILLGIVVGAGPALQLARVNLSNVLREEGRSGTAGRASRVVRRSLVVAQVALAFVLLIGAGLLLASFQRLLGVDPGFVAENVLTGRVSPPPTRYADDKALRGYTDRVLARLRTLPGVEAAGGSSYLPFSWDGSSTVIIPEGYVLKPGESVISPNRLAVSPGYLEAMKVRLKSGRLFSDADNADAPGAVIVDENLARKFWPNQDPVGKRAYMPDSPEDVARPGPKVTWMTVVGVVGAVKLQGLVEGGETARAGAFYMTLAQQPARSIGLAVRAKGDLAGTQAAVQRALAEVDADVPMTDIFSMTARIDKSLNPRRAPMLLSLGFGVVALLLASIGLYGVLAYHVSQRTREIGIRMALGSDTSGILRLILGEGGVLVAAGLAGGLIGAVVLRDAIASQLYGVGALDPLVMAATIGVLGFTSLVACWGPARRAARVSPLVALSRQ
jgi:predicted permease